MKYDIYGSLQAWLEIKQQHLQPITKLIIYDEGIRGQLT